MIDKEKAIEAGKTFKVVCLFMLWGAIIALTWIASTPGPKPPAEVVSNTPASGGSAAPAAAKTP
jgi:hypothetical protein